MAKLMIILFFVIGVSYARNIRIQNNCKFTIWPGWQGQSGTPSGGGTTLPSGQSHNLEVPDNWTGGRIWARTGCDKNFNCETGGCGNSEKCNGQWGEVGVTLAEFGLNKWQNLDFYDVSLVDGFNLLTTIKPEGGSGDCKEVGKCNGNILDECPNELKVVKNGKTVECQSACTKFRKEEFCCTGSHGSDATCGPTNYSKFFKDRCPQDYSYAFDDKTSVFTCKGSNYVVTFC